jgi:hypothetical protein
MLQTDITILEQRQKALEQEIDEALFHWSIDDPMIAYLKSRILYVKEEIYRLRNEAFATYRKVVDLPRTQTASRGSKSGFLERFVPFPALPPPQESGSCAVTARISGERLRR